MSADFPASVGGGNGASPGGYDTPPPATPQRLTPDGFVLPAEVEERIVKDADQLIDLYYDQNLPIWEEGVENHNLYFSNVEDVRSDEEKLWRSHIFPPRPQIITESKTAVLYDIITSTSPMIQVEGIGLEDEGGTFGEKLLDYSMRKMKFRKSLPPFLRNVSIQGTEFNKLYHGKRKHVFDFATNAQDLDRFQKSLLDAKAAAPGIPVPEPVADPKGFAVYRDTLAKAGVKIIPPPLSGKRDVCIYEGPMLERVSFFDIWLDPTVEDLAQQPAVLHRLVKHERWWRSLAGPEPWQPFDAAAVDRALSETRNSTFKHYADRYLRHKQSFYDILGLSPSTVADPIWDKAHEGFECYFGTDGVPGEYPYVVFLNGCVINKNPSQMPYMHGQIPIFAGRNLTIGGLFHGISDYRPLKSIFMENAALRNLRIDGAKLTMLPILAKLASIGTPALMKQLRPGMVVNVPRMDAFTQLFKMTMPEGAWKEPADLQADMDESSAAYASVRGAPASVNRVSATENQSRFNQAISRIKLCASQIEDDHDDFAYQCFGLIYEYMTEDKRLKVGGAGDPYIDITKDALLEAMEQDYKFLGATKAINRELVAQKLNEFGKTYAANLTPVELREIMEDVIGAVGVRNAQRIVSTEGTKDAKDAYTIKKTLAIMQGNAAIKAAQMQAIMPPGVVSGDTAQALGGAAGAPPPEAGTPAPPPTAPPEEQSAPTQ